MTLDAHAKINITLEVLGVRPDGYHDLRSVVLPIPLHDTVTLESADSLSLACAAADGAPPLPDALAGLPPERNLAFRAAEALRRATGCRLGSCISIAKRIPAGAGLGGGSADAAAVLNGLNELWELNLPKSRLCEIAAEVGSDVPALTLGGPVLMEGRGERVTPLDLGYPLPDMGGLVLRVPDVFVSTPEVFREFRQEDRGKGANDLQPAACRLHPEIAGAIGELISEGCSGVMMSGSGSAVFGWRNQFSAV